MNATVRLVLTFLAAALAYFAAADPTDAPVWVQALAGALAAGCAAVGIVVPAVRVRRASRRRSGAS